MAKLMGVIQYSGKLGTTVGYKGSGGRQNVRAHVDTIKNPKTNGQLVQRMICATVGVGVSFLTEILNNAFEGKSFGAESLAYARKLWMNMLRTSDAASLTSTYCYLHKGLKKLVANPYQISEGRLPAPALSLPNVADAEFYCEGLETPTLLATASQVFPAVEVGHQITFVMTGFFEDSNIVKYCRFAFKNDTTPVFIAGDDAYQLNPAAIELSKAEGPWDKLEFSTGEDDKMIISVAKVAEFENLESVGIIISDKENNRRSRSFLVVATNYDSDDTLKGGNVYPTYGATSVEVDFPSEWYLQNSVRPSSAGE